MLAMFGGTFDPIHNAHLTVAREAHKALGGQLRMVPAQVPPHRDQPVASPEQRLAMLKLAVAEHPGLAVDERELQRSGPSYSFDTLCELRREVGAASPLVLVLGADAFAHFDSWFRWRDIFKVAHVLVLTRPRAPSRGSWTNDLEGYVRPRIVARATMLRQRAAGMIASLGVTPLLVSASDIRAKLAAGESVEGLLPKPVLAYIEQHKLYR